MLDHAAFAQLQTRLVDTKGYITQEWRRLLNDMWVLAGGGSVASLSANIVPPIAVPNSAKVLYTSSTFKTRIDAATASNPGAASQTITVYLVPSGANPGAGNMLVPPLSVAAGASVTLPPIIGQILEKGGTIQASSNGNVILAVSGVQITVSTSASTSP